MPTISQFLGISILMYWKDHQPPHFHVRYGDHHGVIAIETGVLRGRLPPRVIGLVQEWRALHQRELMADWRRAQSKQPLTQIQPLE
jgi:hypothetical protein